MSDHDLAVAEFWVSLVGSVATVIALVVAIVLGLREVRAARDEARVRDAERQHEDDRRRRAQAETISAVVRTGSGLHSSEVDDQVAGGRREVIQWLHTVHVTNASVLPIYDVTVTVPAVEDSELAEGLHLLLIPGGETSSVPANRRSHTHLNGRPVAVTFRDAVGIRWQRLATGELSEVDGPTYPG